MRATTARSAATATDRTRGTVSGKLGKCHKRYDENSRHSNSLRNTSRARRGTFAPVDRVPYLRWRYLAPVQVRGKPKSGIHTRRIASVIVVGETTGDELNIALWERRGRDFCRA